MKNLLEQKRHKDVLKDVIRSKATDKRPIYERHDQHDALENVNFQSKHCVMATSLHARQLGTAKNNVHPLSPRSVFSGKITFCLGTN